MSNHSNSDDATGRPVNPAHEESRQPFKPAAFLPAECDIVMEGGITSGVVYPSFIVGLAARFRLRSIGGTSVGAVAAVAAAAAQYRRNLSRAGALDAHGVPVSDTGFAELGRLPTWLHQPSAIGKSNLLTLFQPCAALARHFRLLEAILNQEKWRGRAGRMLLTLPWLFPLGALGGALLLTLLRGVVPLTDIGWIVAAGWAMVGMVLGALVEFGVTAWRGLRANRCGICSGLRAGANRPPALTEWLHTLVQSIAGLPANKPLTFGDLSHQDHMIELRLITTGISELCSHRLPYDARGLVFRKSELEHLLPPELLAWMCAHPAKPRAGRKSRTDALIGRLNGRLDGRLSGQPSGQPNGQLNGPGAADDYFVMPAPEDLPVVVAARMSLSFPILLQAVPLYRMRFVAGPNGQGGEVKVARVWFSDGGLTSNFPIHFFDALLPERPTFGVTLAATLTEGADKALRVSLPDNNNTNTNASYCAIDEGGAPDIAAFAKALIATMRSWRDEALKRTPGYRDRIVLIRHTAREGGLNLNMEAAQIEALRASGSAAAERIIAGFLEPKPEKNAWLNHRWVRMRTAAHVLQTTLDPVSKILNSAAASPSYAQMWRGTYPHMPNAYPLTLAQRAAGEVLLQGIASVVLEADAAILSGRAPAPRPTLAIQPKES